MHVSADSSKRNMLYILLQLAGKFARTKGRPPNKTFLVQNTRKSLTVNNFPTQKSSETGSYSYRSASEYTHVHCKFPFCCDKDKLTLDSMFQNFCNFLIKLFSGTNPHWMSIHLENETRRYKVFRLVRSSGWG